MPHLTVKAAAELLQMPAYEQMRILIEQKHPKSGSQVFRTPFYSPALNGIREYYRSGNDRLALQQAKSKLKTIKLPAKRTNNERVLTSFEGGQQAKRAMNPVSRIKVVSRIGSVDFKLSLDLLAHENGKARYIYYNLRNSAADSEIAKSTIDIAHWVLTSEGSLCPSNRSSTSTSQATESIEQSPAEIALLRSSNPMQS
jgi:hypothetical protein